MFPYCSHLELWRVKADRRLRRRRHGLLGPLDGGGRDAGRFRDHPDGLASAQALLDLLQPDRRDGWLTDLHAFLTSPFQPGHDTRPDHRPLKLGKDPEHLEHHPPDGVLVSMACWCRYRSQPLV